VGSTAPSASPGARASGQSAEPLTEDLRALVEGARTEGGLNVIGLARGWCNYAVIIDAFKQKYGLTVTELDPDAAPAAQVQAVKDHPDGGADAPDVIDVSVAAAQGAKTAKLLAPYKVSTWESIPARVKDPDGAWTGDYYGVLSFEVNASRVSASPQAWADLLEPQYVGRVALAGDPRVSSQASLAVYAAALANGGTLDDARKGLDFFKQLGAAGNLVPRVATTETIDQGLTPVTIRWTYNSLWHRDGSAGNPEIDVTVPKTGRLAQANAQAISARAPHPNAARLWLEFLYSDQGQKLWLDGYCHPIRFDDLSKRDAIPVETLAKLPETSPVVFPTPAQTTKAMDLVAANWDKVVGVDIH
jgi:putative spermidine/putrescine transport system substrate-binding protein